MSSHAIPKPGTHSDRVCDCNLMCVVVGCYWNWRIWKRLYCYCFFFVPVKCSSFVI